MRIWEKYEAIFGCESNDYYYILWFCAKLPTIYCVSGKNFIAWLWENYVIGMPEPSAFCLELSSQPLCVAPGRGWQPRQELSSKRLALISRVNMIKLVLLFILSTTAQAACRDQHQVYLFKRQHGVKPGMIVDHVCPLSCGGIDDPYNMQYQTMSEASAKDRWEIKPYGCKKLCNPHNSTPTRQVFNCR